MAIERKIPYMLLKRGCIAVDCHSILHSSEVLNTDRLDPRIFIFTDLP